MSKKSAIIIEAEDIIKHQGKHYADQAQQIARNAMNPTSRLKPVNRAYADDGEHSVGGKVQKVDSHHRANQSKHGLSSPLSPNQS